MLSSAATTIAQKTVLGDDGEGWGKGEGVNPSRPLLMAVFLFFPVAAHVFFYYFTFLYRRRKEFLPWISFCPFSGGVQSR
jgi:hypothetical protein